MTWADGVFTFNGSEGSFATHTHEGVFNFAGSIHYTKHHGALDMTLSNFALKAKGRNVTINADVKGKDMGGDTFDKKDLALGAVDLSGHTHEGSKTLFKDAPVVFTAEGAAIFGGTYSAGDPMDTMTGEIDMAPKQNCVDVVDDGNGQDEAGDTTNPSTDTEPGTDTNSGDDVQSSTDTKPSTDTKTDSTTSTNRPKVDMKPEGTDKAKGDKGKTSKDKSKANPKASLAKTGSTASVLVALSASAMALGLLLRRRA